MIASTHPRMFRCVISFKRIIVKESATILQNKNIPTKIRIFQALLYCFFFCFFDYENGNPMEVTTLQLPMDQTIILILVCFMIAQTYIRPPKMTAK